MLNNKMICTIFSAVLAAVDLNFFFVQFFYVLLLVFSILLKTRHSVVSFSVYLNTIPLIDLIKAYLVITSFSFKAYIF